MYFSSSGARKRRKSRTVELNGEPTGTAGVSVAECRCGRGAENHFAARVENVSIVGKVWEMQKRVPNPLPQGRSFCILAPIAPRRGGVISVESAVDRIKEALSVAIFAYLHVREAGFYVESSSCLVGDILNTFGVARLSIDMDRHDSRCLGRDGRFYAIRVNISRLRINIDKNRTTSVPPDTMRSRHKTVWRRDDFTRYPQSL